MEAAPSLYVNGGATIAGAATVPGDKSLSHRVLMFAAIADGRTEVRGLSTCRDVGRTLSALEAMGVAVQTVARSPEVDAEDKPSPAAAPLLRIEGRGPRGLAGPAVAVDCGDSGTTLRLLAGLLAGQDRTFVLFGSEALRARPMQRIVTPLRAMGADVAATDGRAPVVGAGGGLRGADILLEKASAQVGSAVLLGALNADGQSSVRYPSAVRDHTERMLADMDAPLRWSPRSSVLHGPVAGLAPPGDGHYHVPSDPSGAAFLWVAAAISPGGEVHTPGICLNPGRDGILEILRAMGAVVAIDDWRVAHGEPVADVTVRHAPLRATRVAGTLIPRAIDELPLLAVLGAFATGRTVLADAAELRAKESDRIEAIVAGLGRMGAHIEARRDGFVVDGPTPLIGAKLAGHGDHRIVMSLAVASLAAAGETVISDGNRPADSFPGFVETLRGLGAEIRRA